MKKSDLTGPHGTFDKINDGVAFLTLGALLTGLHEAAPVWWTAESLNLTLFSAFFFLLRLKFYMDDSVYFRSLAEFRSWHFAIGFSVGLLSWALMAVAAASVKDIHNAYLLLLLAVAASTVWIVVDAIRSGAYQEQFVWFATNASYTAGLGFLIWRNPRIPGRIDAIVLVVMIFIIAIDYVLSRPIQNMFRPKS